MTLKGSSQESHVAHAHKQQKAPESDGELPSLRVTPESSPLRLTHWVTSSFKNAHKEKNIPSSITRTAPHIPLHEWQDPYSHVLPSTSPQQLQKLLGLKPARVFMTAVSRAQRNKECWALAWLGLGSVTEESLTWGFRHPELKSRFIPVINALLHELSRCYF